MRPPYISFCLFLLGFGSLNAGNAEAAAITNLDVQPQTIELLEGTRPQPVTIAPNATWRMPGMVKVRFNGLDVRLEDDDEFAIWKGGDFGPQKRRKHATGIIQ